MKTDHHPQFDKDRLKAISIAEVARRLGDTVRRTGQHHTTLCPWHEDHHPSLSLVERTGQNYCHCFSCGRGGDVLSFVMQHEQWTFQEACQWLSTEFGVATADGARPVPRRRQKPLPAVPATPDYSYLPTEMAERIVSAENSLCQCLMRLFHPEAVKAVAEEYRLGCWSLYGRDDNTVFPLIDQHGRVKNLKVQLYDTDPASPRFAKSVRHAYWLAKMWVNDGRLPRGTTYTSEGLFGEHLLREYPAQTVALVESPKNAVVGTLQHPELLWVAAGNKTALKRPLLEPLRERNVVVIPDRDAITLWQQQIQAMSDMANFTVSDFCERMAPADQPKYDIADYIIEQRLRSTDRQP